MFSRHIERLVPGIPGMDDLYQAGLAKYQFAAQYSKGAVVLDAGCGSGYGSSLLCKKGAKKVVAIDKSGKAIDFAKSHYKKRCIEFTMMDCTKMSFENNSFDSVVSFEVIEHIQSPRDYLKEIRRVLKKGGYFILSTPNKIFGSFQEPNPYHKHEFEFWELKRLLQKYFSVTQIYGFDIVHPQAIKYAKASKRLEFISYLSKYFSFVSYLIPKRVKDEVFNILTPQYPAVTCDDFRISRENPAKDRVFIAVSK